jgi:phosphomannomutase
MDKNIIRVEFNQDLLTVFNLGDDVIAEYTQEDEHVADLFSAKKILENIFNISSGFGKLLQMNFLDGLRCYFDNDEIIHIRPSGNAPQLRVYAYARSQQRADKLVFLGIEEPEGLLRQLERRIDIV